MKVRRSECRVISLAYGGDGERSNRNSKVSILGNSELLIVIKLVLFTAVGPSLLHPLLVTDGSHEDPVPLNVSLSAPKSRVKVDKRMASSLFT